MADYNFVDKENLKTVVKSIKSKFATKEATSEISNSLEDEVLRAKAREQEIIDTHEKNMDAIEDRIDKLETTGGLTVAEPQDITDLFG